MKTTMIAAAAMILAMAASPVAALAAEIGASSGDAMARIAEKQPSHSSMNPHYQWQYHYGHHAQFEGQWALVR